MIQCTRDGDDFTHKSDTVAAVVTCSYTVRHGGGGGDLFIHKSDTVATCAVIDLFMKRASNAGEGREPQRRPQTARLCVCKEHVENK